MLRMRLLEALLEQVELELRADHRLVAQRACALDLGIEHLPRRRPDGRAITPTDVTEHERSPLQPGNTTQRLEIGPHREVAVSLLPACDRVAGNRIHLHVEREQVVTALDTVVGDVLVEEVLRMDALAHQPALHVRERDDDGVDRPGLDLAFQLVERQHRQRTEGAGLTRLPPLRIDPTPRVWSQGDRPVPRTAPRSARAPLRIPALRVP